ncbi:ComEC/Rec2 family competence protein [Gluconobacter morbifer]|uniref:Putative DNA uptake protein n=1 Tax=Gluconobacter morbifer G707 TaxID=1088869 RepID=G6XMH5_9PROT|nr:ComEC/Rec2 family competence protein [Gluconobacter morbifer]EHH67073.1 putative DNA uptake protein [Gluconobacter morbifer G707]
MTLLMLGLGFGNAAFQTLRQPPMPALPTHAAFLTGRITTVESLSGRGGEDNTGRRLVLSGVRFETALDTGMPPMRRTLRIRLKDSDPAVIALGSFVRLRAMVRPPPPPALPGGRDFQREAWFSGVAGSGYALDALTVEGQSAGLLGLETLREGVADRIRLVLPGQTGAIAATLLAGESAGIDAETRQAFSASGLAHLLAVAGLHLGLVMAVVIACTRVALAMSEYAALHWPCRQISVLTGFVAGCAYVLLTGAHLPSLRALGMAAFVTLALLTGRRVLSMRSLSLVALLILAVSPVSVLDVSFQMSFTAVMGLIAGYEVLRDPLSRLRGEGEWHRVALSHLAPLSLTSLLAGLATLPVSMAHFGTLQPWFVLANLIAVPLAAVWIMPAGLLALLLMPFHAETLPLRVMGQGLRVVEKLARCVASFPMAHKAVPAMPGWGLLCVMMGLCVLCLWRGPFRLSGIAPVVLGVLSLWLVARPVVLVAPDAGLIAIREQGQLLAGPYGGLERSVLRDWEQMLALPIGTLPAECTAGPCRIDLGGQTVLLRVREPSLGSTRGISRQAQPAAGAGGIGENNKTLL